MNKMSIGKWLEDGDKEKPFQSSRYIISNYLSVSCLQRKWSVNERLGSHQIEYAQGEAGMSVANSTKIFWRYQNPSIILDSEVILWCSDSRWAHSWFLLRRYRTPSHVCCWGLVLNSEHLPILTLWLSTQGYFECLLSSLACLKGHSPIWSAR